MDVNTLGTDCYYKWGSGCCYKWGSECWHKWVSEYWYKWVSGYCYKWVSGVTREWVSVVTSERCHNWVLSQVSEWCHTWVSECCHKWALSQLSVVTSEWVSVVTIDSYMCTRRCWFWQNLFTLSVSVVVSRENLSITSPLLVDFLSNNQQKSLATHSMLLAERILVSINNMAWTNTESIVVVWVWWEQAD